MSIVLDGTTGITTPAETVSGAVTAATVTATGLISGATNYTGFKNLLIDAGFTINQRGYLSAATLASGSYGHDRWKAGASGGDYTFTQLASSTTITIASGKSLIQVVEDKNVNGTSFVLSWTGTAQARYAVNSATPSGSYAASPILITGQTVGTTMSVEFNTGTLTNPQLELGSTATSFDYRPYGTELALCQRYLPAYNYSGVSGDVLGSAYTSSAANAIAIYSFKVSPRVVPTGITVTGATNFLFSSTTNFTATVLTFGGASYDASKVILTSSGMTAGQGGYVYASGTSQILFTGCEL